MYYINHHFEMLDYSFNVFVIIYSLHFFFFVIIYLEEDLKKKKKKKLDIGFTNWEKKKIHLRFLRINQIL